MVPDRRSRISGLYHEALARPADERRAFLMETCKEDEVLRQEVESLLAFESAAAPFLETPAAEMIAAALGSAERGIDMVGHHFGPYTIVALLGAGGMGE